MCVLLLVPKYCNISTTCMPMHARCPTSQRPPHLHPFLALCSFSYLQGQSPWSVPIAQPMTRPHSTCTLPQYTQQSNFVHGVSQAQKPVQVTCPFGSLDPLMDRAHLAAFPVPAGLLQGTAELHTDAQRSGLDVTRYGQSFCSNAFKGDAAAMLAAAQRQAYMSCMRASAYMLMGQ